MTLVHRRTIARKRVARLSGSIARDRASGIDRFEQSAAGIGGGADFLEAEFVLR
jgi:hypothetical protein